LCIWASNRGWQAPVAERIIHEAIGEPKIALTAHGLPATDQVRALVIEADVKKLVVPLQKRAWRDVEFLERLFAVGTTEGLADPQLSVLKDVSGDLDPGF
jgi:hypothetical protein